MRTGILGYVQIHFAYSQYMNRFTSFILSIRADRGLYIGKYPSPGGKSKKGIKGKEKGKKGKKGRKEKEKEKMGSKRLNKCKI
jgi:hypothetical protein